MTTLELQEHPAHKELQKLQGELDGYLKAMVDEFPISPAEEVFRCLSAWTARATELKVQLSRSEKRQHASFRTKELDPFLEECDRQFKLHSRIVTLQEMDLKLVPRGQT